jgi:hypothetical protein
VRQRPLTFLSKVVTTEVQLDINVERLLLNRGRANFAPPTTASTGTSAGNSAGG